MIVRFKGLMILDAYFVKGISASTLDSVMRAFRITGQKWSYRMGAAITIRGSCSKGFSTSNGIILMRMMAAYTGGIPQNPF